jgi:energy-coupling factor transporter ATP-binding protein EcfA2
VSLSISEGEAVGLIGPNGCGKTTLFLLASGLLRPLDGKIFVGRKWLKGKDLRERVKCAFQNPDAQLFGTTVKEELEFGLLRLRLCRSEIEERIERAASHLPFDLSADPFSLSYGQKKILTIVTTFLLEPRIVILDEPTAGMDYKNIMILHNLAGAFLNGGGSLLISSHSLPEVKALSHRVLVMESGRIRTFDLKVDESS